jgi:hypothetical protein
LIVFTLKLEAIFSSETSVPTRTTQRHIPEEDILRSDGHENLKSYITLTCWALYRRGNGFSLKYALDFYVPEEDILHSHSRDNLKPCIALTGWAL